jgi:hypothetical protein
LLGEVKQLRVHAAVNASPKNAAFTGSDSLGIAADAPDGRERHIPGSG